MKIKLSKRIISSLLTLIMIAGMLPTSVPTVHAGHTCSECGEWIDGSPYCSECYACDECVELCLECGKCTGCSGAEICDGCSDEESGNMCTDCSEEKGTHCPECDSCYFIVHGWCVECGACESCTEICEDCSVNLGYGMLCWECAESKDSHCPGCGGCYFETGLWCEECGLCVECSENDNGCSIEAGEILCKECASDRGHHCPECEQCYFDVGSWCEECGKCADCSPECLYCCEEAGEVICEDCAIENGMHCSECSGCYDGGEFCIECGVCSACADICTTDELCIDCAIADGYHCPSCEECGDQAVICEGCGERCIDCASDFCENCNLCSECVLICQGCASCEECAIICPSCEEYCSECEGICDYCDLCLVCCEDLANIEGCDCTEWVCIESIEWNEHFIDTHTEMDGSHNIRPVQTWSFDDDYHWHTCAYCDEAVHQTGKGIHSYDATGKCTTCYYVKDAKIQIVVQPKDAKDAYVKSDYELPDERNLVTFTVKAIGNSKLTYTWYEGYYNHSLGAIKYSEISREPEEGEYFDGSKISIYVSTDACYHDWYVKCVITDEDGNEVATRDALVQAKHNYQYYEGYVNHEKPCPAAERNLYGHVLQCIGEGCEDVSRLLPHEDEDRDGFCDICDFKIGKILITKQPKDDKNVYVYGPREDYTDNNFAHFSVSAEGESELTYTWCRKMYVGGVQKYVPLTNPVPGECFDGPNASILVPMDACCNRYTYACIITDEEDNETRTIDVYIEARHNYQYFEDYLSTRENPYFYARKRYNGHILVCVGEGCEKVTRLRQHEDTNLDYICEICDFKKDMYETIGISVTAPVEGNLPNYNVTCDRPACYTAMGNSDNYTQYRFWFVSDNGVDNWRLMDKNTPFVAGKYYKFEVEMATYDGYEFWQMVSYDGEEPYIWAYVNGNLTKAHKTYGKDPSRFVTISYEFGICNDSVIENIVIENVTTPVAGEKPTYSATVRGSGYYIDYQKNVQLDDYWNNPQKKPHYIKNGIGWFDVTKFDWVYENETFIPGHQYEVCVYLKTDDGYTFYHDKSFEMLFTASVNGFAATGNTTSSDGLKNQTISTSFNCEGKKITNIMVYGLSVPRAGKTPDYTATAAYPEWYQLDPNYAGTGGIVWFDNEGNQMEATDTFVEGEIYKAEIKIVPTKLEGANTSQFVSPLTAYLNGKEVIAGGDWDNVYVTSNAVYIYYTFPAAEAPAGCSVSGQITSFNNDSDDITVQLIPQGLPEPAYETIVKGNNAKYYFDDVAEGTYILRVSKVSHVTRELVVMVDNSIIKNIELKLKGDANSDSAVSAKDVVMIRRNLAGGQNIEIDSDAADVTDDSIVNAKDVVKMRRYFSGGWNIVL